MSRLIGKSILFSCILVAASFVSEAHAQVRAYITNQLSNTVSVVDVSTHAIIATIPVGARPYGSAVNPQGTRAFITNADSNSVSVVDTATNTVIATIPVGVSPRSVAFTPNGARAYVTNCCGGGISVIDAATNTLVKSIVGGAFPAGIVARPDGRRIYVANQSGRDVTVIDTTTDTVAATIAIGTQPWGIAVSPDGERVYVMSNYDRKVVVLDTAQNTVVGSISLGPAEPYDWGFGIAISPSGRFAYTTKGAVNGVVQVLDLASGSVVASIPVATNASGIDVDPTSSFVYAATSAGIAVIDTATNSVLTSINVGWAPTAFGKFIGTIRDSSGADAVEESIVEAMDSGEISSGIANLLLKSLGPIQANLAWIAANPSSPDLARIKSQTCSLINQFNGQMDHYVRLRRLPATYRDVWKADMLDAKAQLGCN